MDEFYREQRSGPGRQLLDLVCVALLGLILTLAAGAISRAPAVSAAPGGAAGHGSAGHAKAAADCDTPAPPPEKQVAEAFPAGATLAGCADGEKPADGQKPAAPAH